MIIYENQRGYVLLPVLSLIALLAIFVYMANRSLSVDGKIYQTDKDKDQAFYVAKAGLQHTLWGIREQNACFGYQNLPNTPFDGGGYNATIDTTFGSPVVISTTGTLANGISKGIQSTSTISKTVTIELQIQPNGQNGKDTYLSSAPKDVDTNYGAAVNLTVSNSKDIINSLIEFDLKSIPAGTQVISVSLSLFLEKAGKGSNPTDIEVYRINRTLPWNEGVGTGKKGSPANVDGATWTTYDALTPWLVQGGDFDPLPIANQLVDGKLKNVWYTWDVTALAQEWLNGIIPNDGMLLKTVGTGKLAAAQFSSSNTPICSHRPKLTFTIRCDCAMQSFSTTGLGTSDLWGMAYIPENITMSIFTPVITTPVGGAWLFVDNKGVQPNWLYLTDSAGLLLGSMVALPPRNGLRDVTRITSGTWAGSLAFTDSPNASFHIVNMQTGLIEASIPTNAGANSFSTAPIGITCIDNALDCTYDGYLAISSAVDKNGLSLGTIGIMDQAGKRKATIDIDTFSPNPWGILHLPGTDNLLVVDLSGQATVIDFSGTIIKSYATGTFGVSSQVQGLALSINGCHPVVNDAALEMLIELP